MEKNLLGSAVMLVVAAGCKAPAGAPAVPARPVVTVPDSSYELAIPSRWAGLYRIDSLSTQELGTARHGALNLVFSPADTSIRPQALVVVAVYDSAAWTAVRAEGGPPPGDSVAAKAGRVYVVALPQSNPFVPGSPDAARFDALELRPAEVTALVRVR